MRKKLIWLAAAMLTFAGCGGNGDRLDKTTDGGVEVVPACRMSKAGCSS